MAVEFLKNSENNFNWKVKRKTRKSYVLSFGYKNTKMLSFYKQQMVFIQIVSKKAKITILFLSKTQKITILFWLLVFSISLIQRIEK